MARLIPSRQNFVCGGPHKGQGETEGPTETALAPSSRVSPVPMQGSVRSGPRPNGHEEHLCRWRVDPTPSRGVRPREQGKVTEDLTPGNVLIGS